MRQDKDDSDQKGEAFIVPSRLMSFEKVGDTGIFAVDGDGGDNFFLLGGGGGGGVY